MVDSFDVLRILPKPLARMIKDQDFAGREYLGGRKTQQDYYAFSEIGAGTGAARGLLLLLADGMGGYKGGDRASSLAVREFMDTVLRIEGSFRTRFEAGLEAANEAIMEEARSHPEELEGMGTTLLAASIMPSGLEWTSVGDSALYLFREGALTRLNEDHSMRAWFEQQAQEGKISREEAETHPFRSRLRSAIMGSEIALIDTSPQPFPLQPGDLLVAATDGHETLDQASLIQLLDLARERDASEIATAVLTAVRERGRPRQDNTTVSVVKIPSAWFAA